jgi:hypothetical protein
VLDARHIDVKRLVISRELRNAREENPRAFCDRLAFEVLRSDDGRAVSVVVMTTALARPAGRRSDRSDVSSATCSRLTQGESPNANDPADAIVVLHLSLPSGHGKED